MDAKRQTAEQLRLQALRAGTARWDLWGPYLAERQWGTVREDYSADGAAWDYLPHDHARSRAYRWGEDGLLGLSDRDGLLCFGLALWNGRDAILKERLFGLTNGEGNHGEDVKELYYYLDALPSHAYLKALYKYPQRAFPYAELVQVNRQRGRTQPEHELIDTEAFCDDRYFDVTVEYAKASATDIFIAVHIANRGPEPASLHILPQLWFRNTWAFGLSDVNAKPSVTREDAALLAQCPELGAYRLYCDADDAEVLFTDNDSNVARLFGVDSRGPAKDAFHAYVIARDHAAVRGDSTGTKAAFYVVREVPAGGTTTLHLRLCPQRDATQPFAECSATLLNAREEADEFYAALQRDVPSAEARHVQRQALAGMILSKQFFYFDVRRWQLGDVGQPPPPAARQHGRNAGWEHLNNADIISMPDKWEYPWFAAWDLAFHCVALALVDPDFAKRQLVLLTREWYMHPNGQLPAYEWAFGDVNPPVHAWAALKVYELDRAQRGPGARGDLAFLERVFHKLMLNFTWWVNRKDAQGRNVFQGGFLGLDNIGVFDRSSELPTGGRIDQADGTSWMAMYALNLMRIALELSATNPVYQDIATKFFEHFLHIAEAMNNVAGKGLGLWHEQDGFFYDVLSWPDGRSQSLEVRSMVGLIPLFAVETLEPELLHTQGEFAERLRWYLSYRPDLAQLVSRWSDPGRGDRRLLALLRGQRMKRVLARMLDESEFLSPYGIRALSKRHEAAPYVLQHGGMHFSVGYQPAESDGGLFGGNSNWRGPIWMPVNYLIIEALRAYHRYYGPDFKVECPTGSGQFMSLAQVADELARRLSRIFLPDEHGRRAVYGDTPRMQHDPHFRDHVLFYEYFHGDTGRGVGASHQTGWTGLIADLLRTRTEK
jgi:hypothetical protein